MYRTWYTVSVAKKPKSPTRAGTQPEALERQGKRVPAIFYHTEAGGEPVRDWLKELSSEDRKRIGEDIKTVEFGWLRGTDEPGPEPNRTRAFLYRQEKPDGLAPRVH
jgi:hypothetical protein